MKNSSSGAAVQGPLAIRERQNQMASELLRYKRLIGVLIAAGWVSQATVEKAHQIVKETP